MKKLCLIAALVMFAGPALAVDLSAQITQLDGKPLVGQDGKDVPFALGDALKNALLYTDQSTKPDEKTKRFWLALKVSEAMNAKKDMVFSPEEIVEIKAALNQSQSILIAGQAIRLIDPTSAPK